MRDDLNSVGSTLATYGDAGHLPLLLTQKTAADLVGIPYSTMRKAFMPADKRPRYIRFPPPHTYLGRSPRIFADKLLGWALTLGDMRGVKKRGRPSNRTRDLKGGEDV